MFSMFPRTDILLAGAGRERGPGFLGSWVFCVLTSNKKQQIRFQVPPRKRKRKTAGKVGL
jgi:hypothetical protein